jgi:hypothetical protein
VPPVVELPAVDNVKDDDIAMDAAVDVQDGRTSLKWLMPTGAHRLPLELPD